MATIADVARAAGVSVATVSRVMNGSGLVAESTARAVHAAIRELNYVPNQQARNLRRHESHSILVLLPNITNPYYANVFAGINQRAQELGYNLFLCNTDERDVEQTLRDAINCKRADGAILLQTGYAEKWPQKYQDQMPLVQCCEYAGHGDIPRVSVDNYRAALEATQYLIGLGHKRIGTISARNRVVSTRERLQGFRDAMKQAGLPVGEASIGYTDEDYDYNCSLDAARQLLSRRDRPSALFCISDSVALAAVVAANEMGLRVPEDVSIVGFDDVIYTQMFHPYLTTVSQPCPELGRQAVEMLHCLITQSELPSRKVVLPHGFVIRESTCPPEK